MRQTFDETTDRSFGPRHVPLIRQAMAAQGLDGFLVPHEDEHQNEYLPEANDRLAWATGFTGSAGAAVILKDAAAVFVDGRYTLQVRDQVDEGVFEIRDLVEGGPPAYLETAAKPGWTIGYDPKLHSPDALAPLRRAAERVGAVLKPVSDNPLDAAYQQQRREQQGVRLDHPLRLESRGVQVGLDGGQRHVDHRAVDEGHAGADDGGGEHPGLGRFGATGDLGVAVAMQDQRVVAGRLADLCHGVSL
jgi:hypothetical protein